MFDETLHAKSLKNELNVSFGGHSAKGLKAENQDAFAALNTKAQEKESKGVIACLADGCSSAKNAKQASQLSVTHFINEYLKDNLNREVVNLLTTIIKKSVLNF